MSVKYSYMFTFLFSPCIGRGTQHFFFNSNLLYSLELFVYIYINALIGSALCSKPTLCQRDSMLVSDCIQFKKQTNVSIITTATTPLPTLYRMKRTSHNYKVIYSTEIRDTVSVVARTIKMLWTVRTLSSS